MERQSDACHRRGRDYALFNVKLWLLTYPAIEICAFISVIWLRKPHCSQIGQRRKTLHQGLGKKRRTYALKTRGGPQDLADRFRAE